MDQNLTDVGGDAPGLLESPPMSHSMVVREIKRVVQVLEELGTTPLIDTRQITLVDLSTSGSELEGDAERVPRCVLFPSPEQPTKTQLTSTQGSEEWLISLASPAPVAGTKAGVAPASTVLGAALQGIKLEAAGASNGCWLDLLSLGETKGDSSTQPSTVEAGGDGLRAAIPDLLLSLNSPAVDKEPAVADLCASEEGFAVTNMDTTFAIPAVPSAPATAAAPKKATSYAAAKDATVTFPCNAIPSMPAGQSNATTTTTCSPDELLATFCGETGTANLCASHEDLAVASGDVTFAIPAVPAAPSLAAVPKKGTYDMAVADATVTLGHSTVVHRPAEQLDSTQESLVAQEEAAAVDPCVIKEDLAVANADTTFAIPSTPAAPKKGTSDTGAVGATMTLGQGTVAHRPAEQSSSTMPRSSLAAIQEPSREEAATVGQCASEEGLAEANAETTFAVPALPTVPSTAALPRKARSATTAAADTTVTLRGPVGLRKPTSGQPLPPRRSMLPPPSQRAGRLSVPSRPTMARGRPSVCPAAAADTTFGLSKTRAPEGLLSAPKNALQANQQAGAASKPATGMPGPKVVPPLRQPAGRASGRANAAPRLSLQAPAVGAQTDGAAKRGPPSRLSMVPGAAAAAAPARTSLRPPARPAATGLRRSVAGPQKGESSAGQQKLVTAPQAAKPRAQPVPQPKPEAAMASQLPRSRLLPPRTRATDGGLPRPAASRGAPSNRPPPPLLLPIVESPGPSRLSSTPVRHGAPMCGAPDLTPIRKQH